MGPPTGIEEVYGDRLRDCGASTRTEHATPHQSRRTVGLGLIVTAACPGMAVGIMYGGESN